jgi:type II secretory pathway pseudopilin PulG
MIYTKMTRRRSGESGFAMLLVFVMAAVIAISLFMELPRVAFESQRAREELLVDRGTQYRRAVQVFYRKVKRYPATMDELESFQNVRFLRHKYKDPLTGKDDWRIVHMGPGGVLTDSLVQKPEDPLKAKDKLAAGAAGAPGAPANPADPQDPNAPAGFNPGLVRRPSDRVLAGAPGPASGVPPAGDPADPNQPQYPPPQPPPAVDGDGNPIANPAGQAGNGQPGQPGVPPGQPVPMPILQPGQQPFNPNNPNQPYTPIQPTYVPGRGGFVPQYPVPQPNQQPGQQPPGAPSAPSLIQSILTTPRQPPVATGAAPTSGLGNGSVGGGIAGVASKYEGEGIKIINERKKYKEWEFVYDFKNDRGVQGQTTGQGQGQIPKPPPPGR